MYYCFLTYYFNNNTNAYMEVINQNNINEVIQSQIQFTEKTIESVALSTAKMSKSIKL